MRRAKIVCTLGPASADAATIGALIDAGMDVARLNFSHGEHAEHEQTFRTVRAEAAAGKRPVAVLQDLSGPKLRVGRVAGGAVELVTGGELLITASPLVGDATRVSVSYPYLADDLAAGAQILIDDGLIDLRVLGREGDDLRCQVVEGGTLHDRKGVNLPRARLRLPSLTDKDRADLEFGLRLGVDLVALSFVRAPEDVAEVKQLVAASGRRVPVLAKIEKPEAVERLDEIIDASDGVLIARGDLAVELGAEKVPLVQKRCIDMTNHRGKPVIVATQMLMSMVDNPRPSRAEVSDVANAVLDGTDALMLSGETAVGRYPVAAAATMARIIEEIEESEIPRRQPPREGILADSGESALEHAAVVASRQLGLRVIAVATEHGASARLVADYRPAARIVAVTFRRETYHALALEWGVRPYLLEAEGGTDDMVGVIERLLRREGLAESGETVAITLGVPPGPGQKTNVLKLHQVA